MSGRYSHTAQPLRKRYEEDVQDMFCCLGKLFVISSHRQLAEFPPQDGAVACIQVRNFCQ